MKQSLIYTFFIVLLLFSSCQNKNSEDQFAKLIDHYSQNPQDSLKLKAAKFLIKNIAGLKTLDTTSVANNQIYFDVLDSIYKARGINKNISYTEETGAIDSLNKVRNLQPNAPSATYNDEKKVVTADFLIANIDDAFYVWRTMPWCKSISFDDFCEYILPYRCIDTYSLSARKFFLNKYKPMLDSMKDTKDCFKVADAITKDVNVWFSENVNMTIRYPYLSPTKFSDLLKGRFGNCLQTNALKVTILRSLGIPTALDGIPNWGNNNSSHYCYKVIDPPHDTIRSFITNRNLNIKTQHIFSASSYDEKSYSELPAYAQINYGRSIPKVYRETFSRQANSLAAIKSAGDDIPPYFRNDRLKDVTASYLKTATVNIDLKGENKGQKYIYLCVFDNQIWTPVAWSKLTNNAASFKNMGKNIVYLPAYYSGSQYYAAGSPFLLKDDGTTEEIKLTHKTANVTLHAKFPCRSFVLKRFSYFLGGRFQFANKADLSDTVTIYSVKKIPYYQTEIKVQERKKFRYLVYQFKNVPVSYISELAFYGLDSTGKEVKLDGKLIGHPGMYPNTADKINDGDRNSVFSSKITGGWDPKLIKEVSPITYIGIDLKSAKTITRIVFTPASDDNAVIAGDPYQLYYWDNGWNLFNTEEKIAEGNSVTFNNVPQGALFVLKNTKGGKEERIFQWKNGRQVFW